MHDGRCRGKSIYIFNLIDKSDDVATVGDEHAQRGAGRRGAPVPFTVRTPSCPTSRPATSSTLCAPCTRVSSSTSRPTWLKLDLSMAQFKALVAVERQAGVGVCRLGEHLGVGESAASLLVEQLVRRGYVSRETDPADRRRVALGVTAMGAKRLRELRQGSDEIMHEWLAALTGDDRDALARGLGALAEVVCSPGAKAADPLCHPAPAPLESRTS